MAEVAESQDVEARSVEGEVVEVNEANSLKKIKRKKNNRCLCYIFFTHETFPQSQDWAKKDYIS